MKQFLMAGRRVKGSEREITVLAPAKVNLALRVFDRRPDGYHNLWSLMHTVGLEDELRFRLRPGASEVRLRCDDPALPTDGRNLVLRAAGMVLDRAGRSPDREIGLDIHLTKRIPVSAGLGGGSSDAAATILALNHLLGLGWSVREMVEVGQALGSDVPFFFFAPSARVRGRGEDVSALAVTGQRWAVLVHPGFPIETRWAYHRLAETRREVRALSAGLVRLAGKASLSWEEIVPLMENDFEQALAPTHGVLLEIKMELIRAGAETALLSGSGATVFGIFRDEASAVRALAVVGQAQGRQAYAVRAGTEPLTCREGPAAVAAPGATGLALQVG